MESLTGEGNAPVAAAAAVVKVETVAATTVMPLGLPDKTGKVFLQLGAFRERMGAQSFLARMRSELGDTGKDIVLQEKRGLIRVHIGPYNSADEARRAANTLASRLGFKPFVSQRQE